MSKTNLEKHTDAVKDQTKQDKETKKSLDANANANLAVAGQMAESNKLREQEIDIAEDRLELDEQRLAHDERKREDAKEHNERVVELETMKATDVSTSEGVARYDQVKKDDLDRTNQQEILDLLGDCIACIETDGKPSEKFDEPAYSVEKTDTSGLQKVAEKAGRAGMLASMAAQTKLHASTVNQTSRGISHAYRYHNLGAALAKILDIREEVQRVRVWDMNVTREATLEKIEKYIPMAREKQDKAGRKVVKVWNKGKVKAIKMSGALAGLGALMVGAAFAGAGDLPGLLGMLILLGCWAPAFYYLGADSMGQSGMMANKQKMRPIGWDDMVDLVEGDDDD